MNLTFAGILFSLLVTLAASTAHAQIEDLGPQITSMTLQGSTFTKDPAGNPLVCTVIRGQPAKLLVFDVRSGKLRHRLALEGADGAWNATTSTDGSVYVGTDDQGHVYRWTPGESVVRDLGQVGPEQTWVWDLTAGTDGEIFCGTYPGCQVIRYHPADGFKDVGKGSVAPGENYARSITYDPAGRKVYVGVGAHAHLVEVDPATGDKRQMLPAKYAGKKFVYTVKASAGRLFALVTEAETFVVELASGKVEGTIPNAVPQMALSPTPPSGDRVYYNAGARLGWYDVKTREHGIAAERTGSILAMSWIDGKLALMTRGNGVVTFDPETGKTSSVSLDVPPEPTPIHYICRGPDDRIYVGGYLSGGLAIFDPKNGRSEQFVGYLPQTEGITTLGQRVYFGCYPLARLYRLDTAKPWDPKQENPIQIDHLDRVGQDRPFAVLGVEALNKVFYGTVPDYGTLGGAMAIVDGATDAVTVHRNLVADQSIVALAQAGELICGGTAIRGGLGIEPKAAEAKLFLFDPKSEKVVFETAPVSGAKLVTGLLAMPDQTVLGVADGVLFAFDPARREIIRTEKLFDLGSEKRSGWRDAMLALHPSGQIYGTANSELFRLDPKTLERTVIQTDAKVGLLALDREGRVYTRSDSRLIRFTP